MERDPLWERIKSRKFLLALGGALVAYANHQPEVAAGIISTFIFGESAVDYARAKNQ